MVCEAEQGKQAFIEKEKGDVEVLGEIGMVILKKFHTWEFIFFMK
jgi:hypothetical protein